MKRDKQQERAGKQEEYTPRDNIDLDVMDAKALGYGCHYGWFKADHPFTKDANEERLARKKAKPVKKKKRPKVNSYVLACRWCKTQFTTNRSYQRYCCDDCRRKADNARQVEIRFKRKQEEMQHD